MADSASFNLLSRRVVGDGKLQRFPAERISNPSQFSAVILTTLLLALFLIRYYILEGLLMERLYGDTWNEQSDRSQRSFLSHHVASTVKFIILVVGCYPFAAVAFGRDSFLSPYAPGSDVTMGDMLVVLMQLLFGLYLFELLFRVAMPTLLILHHLAAIILGQVIIALSLGGAPRRNVLLTFIIMMVWGAFDVIVEIFPHIAMILHRVYNKRHGFLQRIFFSCSATILLGAIGETIVVIYFYSSIFHDLGRAFRIAIPMLHLLFCASQLNGCYIFWRLFRKQQLLLADSDQWNPRLETGKTKDYAVPSTLSSETNSKSSAEVENRLSIPKPSQTRPSRT